MQNQSLGSVLKKERENRKLSVKNVALETSISPRYIHALEENDYSIFPSTTYTIGFLNNYAEYLNLDKTALINLFHQQQLDDSLTPIAELTQPYSVLRMRSLTFRYLFHTPILRILFIVIILGAAGYAVRSLLDWSVLYQKFFGSPDKVIAEYCSGERELRVVDLPPDGASPRSDTLAINPPDSIRVSANDLSLKFCLAKVKNKAQTAMGLFHVLIHNKNTRHNFDFEVQEGQSYTLDRNITGLAELARKIKFTPVVLSDYSARIELETLEVVGQPQAQETNDAIPQKSQKKAPEESFQNNIQITLEFIQASYMEWVKDGQFHRGRIVNAGKIHSFEAQNRLTIKLGNAGGVRIRREGVKPRIAGPVARIVKLEYRRIPNPLDPSLSQVRESVKVIE